MAKTRKTKPKPAQPVDRLELAKQFAIAAAKHAHDTHCREVVVLDVAGLSPVTDFFVLATGTSPVQMRTVCDEIVELGGTKKYKSIHRDGYDGETWMLVDFVDVVLHVFSPDARGYYDLDNLWGDAKKIEWQG